MQPHSKESVITTAGCIRSLREQMLHSRMTGLVTVKWKIKKWLHHIAIFRMELFLSGGVEAKSEL